MSNRKLARAQRGDQHLPDRLTALQRDNIPGKGNQVAPVTLVAKERNGPGDIGLGQCAVQLGQPMRGLFSGRIVCAVDLCAGRGLRRQVSDVGLTMVGVLDILALLQ